MAVLKADGYGHGAIKVARTALNNGATYCGVASLNEEFADIVVGDPIVQTDALPEEGGEPEIAQLPRLVFTFARRQFGRLRMLIDAINAE